MITYLKYKQLLLHTSWISVIFLASCAIPGRKRLPDPKPLPARFATNQDSLQNIALLRPDSFFRDAHLRHAIKDVLQHNSDMQIALQRIRTAGAYLKMSKGALLPSLSMNAHASGTKFGKYTMEGVGNFDTNLSPNIEEDQKVGTNPTPDFWLGLSTSWELDIWGRLGKLKKAAQHRFLASAEAAAMVKSMLVTQTALFYYELLTLDRELEILQENIGLQERALEIVTAQKEGGRATELAVQQFNAQLLSSRGQLLGIRQRITETENNLNALSGKYEGDIARSGFRTIDQNFDALHAAGIPAAILRNRPDIRQAEAEMLAADADLGAARAAFFPSLNLSAYTAFSAFKGDLLFSAGSLGFQLLGGLTAPLFQKHQIRSQYRIAEAGQQEQFYNYERTVLNAYKEVLNYISNIRNLGQRSDLKEEEVTAWSNGVSISEDLYITGYASYIEIVAAQKSKLEAELQLIDLKRAELYTAINLYKSLGGGWRE